MMKKKHQVYLRLNLMSLFLIAVSFISVTLAWFAYSGLATVSTEVDVKAWFIELEQNDKKVTNEITVNSSDLYPGMKPVTETIVIKNTGDSDAELKYSIVSARILDQANYVVNEQKSTEEIEDILSHEFPFSVNFNLSQKYLLAKDDDDNIDEAVFEISISWPLDSYSENAGEANIIDSEWGNKAYNFQKEELRKYNADEEHYQIQPSIQIALNLTAEQYLESIESSDPNYNLGDSILVDVINNSRCQALLPNQCLKMYVIDVNNTIGDRKVTLLPNPLSEYRASSYDEYEATKNDIVDGWQVFTRGLTVEDLLKIISTDVNESFVQIDGVSDAIIGNLTYTGRMNRELTRVITSNGRFKFLNSKFPFLVSTECYWTSSVYGYEKAFALQKDDDTTRLFGNYKPNLCKVIPVVEMDEDRLELES